jgi:ferredoxin
MSKVAILYFSGTANTEYVVKLYQDALVKLGDQVDLIRMEDYTKSEEKIDLSDYSMFGFAYPVHAFNAPRFVFKFIETLPAGLDKPAFIFRVSGDYDYINNGSAIFVREKLNGKGYQVFHESTEVMATNFIVKTPNDFVKKLYKVANEKAVKYTAEIHAQTKRLETVTGLNCLITLLASVEHFGGRMLGKFHYYTTPNCNLCETCVKACPTSNIKRFYNLIRFGFECTLCMRCLYVCPQKAIKVRLFDFIKLKEGFDLKSILEDDSISDKFEKNDNDAFYRKYKDYIEA